MYVMDIQGKIMERAKFPKACGLTQTNGKIFFVCGRIGISNAL